MKKIIFLFMLFSSVMFLMRCSDTIATEKEDFGIKWISVPEVMIPGSSSSYRFEVQVTPFDFQKIDRIKVTMTLMQGTSALFSGELKDDGNISDGDKNKNDGIFTVVLPGTAITGSTGVVAEVVAEYNGIEHVLKDSILTQLNSAPRILGAVVPDTLPEGPAAFKVKVADEDGVSTLKNLTLSLYQDASRLIKVRDVQWNDFSAISDTVFLAVDSSFAAGASGSNYITILLDDGVERDTLEYIPSVWVENSKPDIVQITIPDSIQIPFSGSTLFTIRAEVKDKRGLGDIQRVFVRTGSDFDLLDNGLESAGDNEAGDGIYSAVFSVNSSNPPGSYVFEFHATDKVGNAADTIQKTIVLY